MDILYIETKVIVSLELFWSLSYFKRAYSKIQKGLKFKPLQFSFFKYSA